MKNNKKKKKGFTLIELIAVIAILGILAAIAVPNIQGYTTKAKSGKAVADAKIVVDAVNTYNADAATAVLDTATAGPSSTAGTIKSITAIYGGTSPLLKAWPSEFADTITFTQLQGIANGTITYASSGNATNTFTLDSSGNVTPH